MNNGGHMISVVITCYNQGHYLAEAINSILRQAYRDFQIIVIDDGSTDSTGLIASNYKEVIYIRQENQGLSAARNTGIQYASGEYILFLDADDWLFENALAVQLEEIKQHPDCMAVAGGHQKVSGDGMINYGGRGSYAYTDHYLNMLAMNFIGMHAAVLFRRSFFDEFRYDTTLRAAEDYDLLLNLTRKYQLYVHDIDLAAYRIHDNNMSKNLPMMLSHVLKALKRQEPFLRSAQEREVFHKGIQFWNKYYTDSLIASKINALKQRKVLRPAINKEEGEILEKNNPQAISIIHRLNRKNKIVNAAKPVYLAYKKIKKLFKAKKSSEIGFDPFYPPVNKGAIDWGSFKRATPLSENFGFDRGVPVDRYYIEKFLAEHSMDIKGRVLEIGDNTYSKRFGDKQVTKSDVMHILSGVPGVTIIGDLARADEVPVANNSFDCIILTQTLHLIYEYENAIKQCHRILKPGGVLLLTSPGISQMDTGEWKENWLWSFNYQSLKKIMENNFKAAELSISHYGNVFSATAFLWGISVEEIPAMQLLDATDPAYQVVISVRGVKQLVE